MTQVSWDDWTNGDMTDEEIEIDILNTLLEAAAEPMPTQRVAAILEKVMGQWAKAAKEGMN